jgi:hypothetical protein
MTIHRFVESGRTKVNTTSRRTFLKVAAGAVLVPAIPSVLTCSEPIDLALTVPSHLPRRLAICYYGWQWITTALSDEAFGNLDRAVQETKERGFNCIRAEMGLNWMFDSQGNRRGKLKFTSWIPGFSSNLHCVDAKGGGEHDVFDRVIQLFETADKHDLYVIMTSWEYQDAISQLGEPRIREEILAVPYNERLMLLGRQYDRLLRELRKRGLHKRIAQVEIVNELNQPPIFCSVTKAPPQTFDGWVHRKMPEPSCTTTAVRDLASQAVAYLRSRHPDLLVTVDGLVACTGFEALFPQNAQVADHHVYCDGVTQAFWEKCGIAAFRPPSEPPRGDSNPFLKSVLKPNPVGWDEFVRQAGRVRQDWWGIGWLYANLDNEKFDRWCVEHFPEYEKRIKQSIDSQFECADRFARARRLPLVVDEGFILYPPLHSHFVTTPEGRRSEELGVDGAIVTKHWGIMGTGYFRPDTPSWSDAGQCAWINGLNKKILASATPDSHNKS